MGKIILVTGGARSGKSSYAEARVSQIGGRTLYIATAIPFDDEMRARIKKHQSDRPDHWDTYEGYEDLPAMISGSGATYEVRLLDCVTLWQSNLVFKMLGYNDFDRFSDEQLQETESGLLLETDRLIQAMQMASGTNVLVTNEVGMGLVPENRMGRYFRDLQGRVNQRLGKAADEVILSVCGIPMQVK